MPPRTARTAVPLPSELPVLPLLGVLLALVACATACSTDGPDRHHARASGPPPATAPASAPASASPSARPLVLDEHAARTTVHARPGTPVLVLLHSTYWSTPASSDPGVLAPRGPGGSTPGGTCVPGGGCGTSSAGFSALRPGTSRVTAHRASCGEAMRCRPGQGDFEVTVTVGP
jgi:hypothetical protein